MASEQSEVIAKKIRKSFDINSSRWQENPYGKMVIIVIFKDF
jgi:hypothetical protein